MNDDTAPRDSGGANGRDDQATDGGVDYQVGAHDVDATTVPLGENADDGNFVEFELEARTVFKRLADDIYESAEAGICEPLTNAVTAVLKAVHDGDLEEDEGVVEITVDKSDGQTTLIIRDNGVGITEQELREVVAVVGRSTTRDSGDLAGQFGMGFLAMFKLVGTDGGFVMHTNPRAEGESAYSGVWKSGGFTIDEESTLPGSLGDDEYGTRFELVLKDDISTDDVREWVAENAKRARIPVIYDEYGADGAHVFNDDYGGTSFDDDYPTDPETFVLKVDTPYFTARCSNESLNETILLDVPIERNQSRVSNAPWSSGVDIRLKNENGVVVDGPHEGLMPVTETEYESMSAQRQEKYVPEAHLTDSDITMPGPIGTREILAENPEFWGWLGDQFADQYRQRVHDLFADIDGPEDVWALSKADYKFLREAHPYSSGKKKDVDAVKSRYSSKYNLDLSDDVAGVLAALTRTVDLAPRSEWQTYRKKENLKRNQDVGDLTYNAKRGDRDGTVYMGVTLNDDKASVVHDDNAHNVVVGIESTNDYEFYGTTVGWENLKDVTKSRVRDGEFDVSESVKQDFLGTTASETAGPGTSRSVAADRTGDPRYERLIIHRGTARNKKTKVSVRNLVEACREAATKGHDDIRVNLATIKRLVAFPKSADRNVSDYYHLTDNDTSVFKCSDDAWDVLADAPFVTHIDNHIQAARSVPFETTAGTHTLASAPEDLVFHLVPSLNPKISDKFTDDAFMHRVKRVLLEEPWDAYLYGWESFNDDITYAPVTHGQLRELYAGLDADQPVLYDGRDVPHGLRRECPSPATLYIHAHLLELDDVHAQTVEDKFSSDVTAESERGERAREHVRFYRRATESGIDLPDIDDQ